MAITGKLGIADSQLGNILLGGGSSASTDATASSTLALSQSVSLVRDIVCVASNTLAFSQSEDIHGTIHSDAESTLVLTQDVVVRGPIYCSAESTLAFTQVQRLFLPEQMVSSTLVLSGVAGKAQNYDKSVSDTLFFISVADADKLTNVSNSFTLTDLAEVEVAKIARDQLDLTQDATVQLDPHNERVFQELIFDHTTSLLVDRQRTLESTLSFVSSATAVRWKYGVASSVLPISQEIRVNKIQTVVSALTLSHEATCVTVHTRSVSNSLGLTQTTTRLADYVRSAENQIGFGQGFYTKRDSSGNPVTVPLAIGLVVPRVVTLQIPGLAITLPKPLLGDAEAGLGKIDLKRTETGGTYTYVRRSTSKSLKYKFSISRAKAYEMRNFVLNALATKITMVNWKGEIWYGNLMNNPFELTAQSRAAPCGENYEIDFEFEGIRLN